MSEYYYSFKEKGFFWQPDTESDNSPDDLIPLTDEYYRELMQGQVDGKYIEHRKGGPVLVEHREYTPEELVAAKWHLNRSQFGIRIDHDLASISDHSLASQSITIWHASDH